MGFMDLFNVGVVVAADIVAGKSVVDKPVVFVLVGLQYSGKSFLAERIVGKNFAHFWATKVKADYGISNSGMFEVALAVVEDVAGRGFNVVVDYVNHKFVDRKRFQDLAARLGVGYRVVFIDTPKEVRLARRLENLGVGSMPGRRVIGLEQLQKFEGEFERPRVSEPCVVLCSEDDVDSFLRTL